MLNASDKRKVTQVIAARYARGLSEGFEAGFFASANALESMVKTSGKRLGFSPAEALQDVFEAAVAQFMDQSKRNEVWKSILLS